MMGNELEAELRETQDQKYAINDKERIIGQRADGVPILDEGHNVIAALSVPGPKNRLEDEWFDSEIPDILLFEIDTETGGYKFVNGMKVVLTECRFDIGKALASWQSCF